MIDIHNHLLPDMDDGAKNMDETMLMCQLAVQDGIHDIIATPHALDGHFEPEANELHGHVETINRSLVELGLDLTIHPGAEVRLVPDMHDVIRQKPWLLLARSQYLLVEPPPTPSAILGEEISQLLHFGYRPILAHPERCVWIHNKPDILLPLVASGMLVQITAQSLLGHFGLPPRICAETLIRCRMAHFMASDAHSLRRRPPLLSQAAQRLQELAGEEETLAMTQSRATSILGNVPISIAEPLPSKQSLWKRIFS